MAQGRQLPFGAVDRFAPRKTRLTQQAFTYGKAAGKKGLPGVSTDPSSWIPYVSPGLRKFAAGGFQAGSAIRPQAAQSAPGAPGSDDSGVGGRPLDPLYEARMNALRRTLNQTGSNLGYQEQQVKQDYGFEDASNPFSRAKMLERAYQQNQARTTNTYAARGQLYAGALQNQEEANRFQNEQATDSAKRQYQQLLAGFAQKRQAAQSDYESGSDQADAESLQRQIDAQRATPPEELAGAQPQATTGTNAKGEKYTVTTKGGWVIHRYANGKEVKVRKA